MEKKMNINKRLIADQLYDNRYDEFLEEPDIKFSLREFKGEEREIY